MHTRSVWGLEGGEVTGQHVRLSQWGEASPGLQLAFWSQEGLFPGKRSGADGLVLGLGFAQANWPHSVHLEQDSSLGAGRSSPPGS